jgi:DNA-binding response OmpR family regulator
MPRIAIIDDEQDILNILERYLSKNGYDIQTFSNPQNGLSAVKSGNYDLLLLDIMMPTLDGISLLKDLHNSGNKTKVMMMTAFDTLERSIEAHKFGASNYITKPFKSLDVVKSKIEDILSEE